MTSLSRSFARPNSTEQFGKRERPSRIRNTHTLKVMTRARGTWSPFGQCGASTASPLVLRSFPTTSSTAYLAASRTRCAKPALSSTASPTNRRQPLSGVELDRHEQTHVDAFARRLDGVHWGVLPDREISCRLDRTTRRRFFPLCACRSRPSSRPVISALNSCSSSRGYLLAFSRRCMRDRSHRIYRRRFSGCRRDSLKWRKHFQSF